MDIRRSWRIERSTSLMAIAVCLLALAACKKSKTGESTPSAIHDESRGQSTAGIPGLRKTWGLNVRNQPGTIVHLEYSDNTSIVDLPTVARTLRGVSADHRIFLFQDSPELRQKLVPGKFVLFEGLDLRKVDALAVDGQNLVVGTETAPLPQALKKAQLQWSVPVDFGDLFNQLQAENHPPVTPPNSWDFPARLADWLQPTVYATFIPNSEVEGDAEIMDSDFATWKCHYHYTRKPGLRNPPLPDPGFGQVPHTTLIGATPFWDKMGDKAGNALAGLGLDLDVKLDREAKGLNASIHMTGHLTKFDQVSSVLMADGAIQHASFKNVGLHGYMDFIWEISTSEKPTSMNEVRFKLPGKISIPLIEETGLPMSLQISEAMLFHPAFTTKGEVAKGSFHVDFSGDEGLTVANSDAEPDGEAQGDGTIDRTVSFSPLAAYGLVVAMAFPRIELRMGTEELFELGGIPIPQSIAESLSGLLLHNSIAGQWLDKKAGNPLSAEAAAYFQVVFSTTAADSGMLSLVPCQQFTMTAKGQVGIDSVWLGSTGGIPAKDIFTKNLTQRKPDSKICGGGADQAK